MAAGMIGLILVKFIAGILSTGAFFQGQRTLRADMLGLAMLNAQCPVISALTERFPLPRPLGHHRPDK